MNTFLQAPVDGDEGPVAVKQVGKDFPGFSFGCRPVNTSDNQVFYQRIVICTETQLVIYRGQHPVHKQWTALSDSHIRWSTGNQQLQQVALPGSLCNVCSGLLIEL